MRRGFAGLVVAVALGLLGATIIATAQPSTKAHRIGWLSPGSAPSGPNQTDSDFQQGLRDFGYIEGQNVVIAYRYANGYVERLPDLAAELVRLPVDVIVTSGEPAALAAKRATKTIPIVATEFGLDPVKAGLVASLGRPDGNVTGMATLSEELWEKRLGLLKQVAPNLSRLVVLWNPANPANKSCVDAIKAIAATMSMQARYVEVSDANALERALANIAKDPADALATCWDSVTLANAGTIADFALKHHLPTVAPLREYVDAGALMSFGMSLSAHRRRAAYYVDKILKGTKPSDIPVEQPELFELVMNLRTAKVLGVVVPGTFLLLADEVIH
jgi:putative tryptophan/tyrosine transport system substrate-binding protein